MLSALTGCLLMAEMTGTPERSPIWPGIATFTEFNKSIICCSLGCVHAVRQFDARLILERGAKDPGAGYKQVQSREPREDL